MSFGGSFFGFPRTVLADLEVDVSTLVADAVNDRIGIGDTSPGTTLQVKGEAPYMTLQNSTSENSDGGCESKIIFEDHADVALAQIEAAHSGSSDDTKGKLILSTHTGSSLTAAITINEAQKVTAAGDVQVTGDIILDDGGSLKEAGGTAAITFDGSGHVTKIGQDTPSTNEVLTYDGSKWVASAASSSTDLNSLSAAVVAVAADSIGIIDADDSNASKKESIADFMTAVAGVQATTGLTASSGTLVLTDLHPVGVSGSANQVITDDGDGTVTSEAKLLCDGATTTIGDGTAEDAMLAFDGNAQDFRVGIDDGTDTLEIGQGTTMGTNTAISVNSSGQVTAFNIPAAAVAQASDHIIFLDGGATGAPKAESIDDFLTAIAGSGISVSSSQLTASGGTDLNGLSAAAVDVAADSIGFVDANDSNNSKKESIADLATAMAGTGITATNGVFSVTTGSSGPTPAASSAENIIAFQVFT